MSGGIFTLKSTNFDRMRKTLHSGVKMDLNQSIQFIWPQPSCSEASKKQNSEKKYIFRVILLIAKKIITMRWKQTEPSTITGSMLQNKWLQVCNWKTFGQKWTCLTVRDMDIFKSGNDSEPSQTPSGCTLISLQVTLWGPVSKNVEFCT